MEGLWPLVDRGAVRSEPRVLLAELGALDVDRRLAVDREVLVERQILDEALPRLEADRRPAARPDPAPEAPGPALVDEGGDLRARAPPGPRGEVAPRRGHLRGGGGRGA